MKHTFTKIEWWDVCRRLKPHLTWEEFEKLWEEFEFLMKWKKLQ